MKNTQNSESNQNLEDDLLIEYNFDYRKARPNRFATQENETSIIEDLRKTNAISSLRAIAT